MINIKKKSQQELFFFLNYNKFNLLTLLSAIIEFLFFLFSHFKSKYLDKYFNFHRDFSKKKILEVDKNNILDSFKIIKLNKIDYNKTLKYKNYIRFQKKDPEKKFNDIRYYFLLDFTVKKINPNNIYNKFIKLYYLDSKKSYFKKDIYSASERLSNLILFICYHKFSNYNFEELKKIILAHIEIIIRNIEYKKNLTNNHILNNFRALILSSIFINDKKLFKSSIKSFINFYSLIFDNDGQIREGSSHYHLVIHNWIEDIYFFSKNSFFENKNDMTDSIKKISEYLYKVRLTSSLFAKLYYDYEINIGDISPDLHPKFILNKITNLYLFEFKNKKNNNIFNSNWAFICNKKLTFISKVSKNIIINNNFHHHNDLTSFILLSETVPIIIDLGKFDYTKSNISLFHHSSFSHNCLFVNEMGLYPQFFFKNFLPKNYFTKLIKPNSFIKLKNGFKIITNGFKRYDLLSKYSRKFNLYKNILYIEDEINTSKSKTINLIFNLGKKLKLISKNNKFCQFSVEKSKNIIFDFSNNQIPIDISINKTILSETYGKKIFTNQLLLNFKISQNLKFLTKIIVN